MARTFPTAGVSPIDAYSSEMDRPLAYFESVTTTDDLSTVYCKATLTSGDNAYGVAGYFETHIGGTTSGHIYGFGSWINVDTSAVLSAGNIIVPIEGGVYAGEAQATARIVFAGQHQAILTGAPASIYAWRLNVSQAIGNITAVIAAANPQSVAYTADTVLNTGSKLGNVAMFDIVGVGVCYVEVFSA